LRHTRGDKRLAAQLLGIATRTIYRKLEPTATTEDGSKDPDAAQGYDNLAMEPPVAFNK